MEIWHRPELVWQWKISLFLLSIRIGSGSSASACFFSRALHWDLQDSKPSRGDALIAGAT